MVVVAKINISTENGFKQLTDRSFLYETKIENEIFNCTCIDALWFGIPEEIEIRTGKENRLFTRNIIFCKI